MRLVTDKAIKILVTVVIVSVAVFLISITLL